MANKKLIAGGIIAALIIATITVVGLIPVFMYGSGETLTEVTLGMSTTESTTSTSLSTSSIETSQTDIFKPGTTGAEVKKRAMNAYEYFFHELGGERARVSNQEGNFEYSGYGADIDIYITFNLTTPSNQSVIFEFNPQNLNAEGLDVVVLLDSEDLNGETGEFHLEITISISIEVTFDDTTLYSNNTDLTPVSLDFTV